MFPSHRSLHSRACVSPQALPLESCLLPPGTGARTHRPHDSSSCAPDRAPCCVLHPFSRGTSQALRCRRGSLLRPTTPTRRVCGRLRAGRLPIFLKVVPLKQLLEHCTRGFAIECVGGSTRRTQTIRERVPRLGHSQILGPGVRQRAAPAKDAHCKLSHSAHPSARRGALHQPEACRPPAGSLHRELHPEERGAHPAYGSDPADPRG